MKISEELRNLKPVKVDSNGMTGSMIRRHEAHSKGLYNEALRAKTLKEFEIEALEKALRARDPLDSDYQEYVDAWLDAQNEMGDLETLCIIAWDNWRGYAAKLY